LTGAFREGLRELGYIERKTVLLEARYAEGSVERLSQLARELVALKPDVIVATNDVAIAAVRRETQTIPIVMVLSADPAGAGFVASLARPGGNVTGLSTLSPETSGKRLELLREVIPGSRASRSSGILTLGETCSTTKRPRRRLVHCTWRFSRSSSSAARISIAPSQWSRKDVHRR